MLVCSILSPLCFSAPEKVPICTPSKDELPQFYRQERLSPNSLPAYPSCPYVLTWLFLLPILPICILLPLVVEPSFSPSFWVTMGPKSPHHPVPTRFDCHPSLAGPSAT